jgi:molybdate transport system substrate-binding protein
VAAGLLLAWGSVQTAGADEVLAACAASLREPLTEIARRFESGRPGVRVALSFGASNFLAAQVRAGAPIEVFVSADARIVDDLRAAGLVAADASAAIARNRLLVMSAADGGVRLERPEDLLGPGVRRVAVPEGSVPVGRYAREWLAARGLLGPLADRLVATEHARATLAALDAGHVDAAIVYATDARVARSARPAFEIPAAEQPSILYAAAWIEGAGPPAREFYAFLLGPAARGILGAAGFTAP